jgi:mRNA interferase HicA
MVLNIILLVCESKNKFFMKSTELHKLIKKNGWLHIRTKGSHYIYEKDGKTYPAPFHAAKEVGKGIENKIKKEMGLK